jgi:hypothetical protein
MDAVMARLNAYERLIRLDKPIGILLLLWPTLWGLWLAARDHRMRHDDGAIVGVQKHLAHQHEAVRRASQGAVLVVIGEAHALRQQLHAERARALDDAPRERARVREPGPPPIVVRGCEPSPPAHALR